jgi:hypothetical protein
LEYRLKLGEVHAVALAADNVRLKVFQHGKKLRTGELFFDAVYNLDLMLVPDLSSQIS